MTLQKLFIASAATLLLVACGDKTANNPTVNEGSGSMMMDGQVVKNGDTVSVDYVGKFPDGTLFDTSLESEAKAAGKFQEGRPYQPFSFVVGQGQVVPGFDKNVLGMKVGETKTFTLPPEEAYGMTGQLQSAPIEAFAPTIRQFLPRAAFDATITQSVPVSEVKNYFTGALTIGTQVAFGPAAGQLGTLKSLSGETAEFMFNNTANPFLGKELAVGLTSKLENGADVKILSFSGDTVEVESANIENPFLGKQLVPGMTGKLQGDQTIKILSIGTGTVDVEIMGPMVGKTLVFTVTVREIKATPAQ